MASKTLHAHGVEAVLAGEPRQWLITAVDGLMTRRHCEGSWCAYKEELSHPGWGGATAVPSSNAKYGTGEAPLNQNNDDPVSDLLYTSNFALLGLHEARLRRLARPPRPDHRKDLRDQNKHWNYSPRALFHVILKAWCSMQENIVVNH